MGTKSAERQAPTRRRPTAEQLRQELEREKKRKKPSFLRIILFLIIVLLIAAITFFCLLSGYVVYGDSMAPTLQEGDLVLAIPNAPIRAGDMVAFRHDERILIKRAVAGPGDRIEISEDGHVRLNGTDLGETYASFGAGIADDMVYPVDIPAGAWFVLGDNRTNSVDSRSTILGMIDNSQMQGRIFIRIWPLNRIELFDPNFLQDLFQ